jgi:hypothetical protein
MHRYLQTHFDANNKEAVCKALAATGVPFAVEDDYGWTTVDITHDTDGVTENEVRAVVEQVGAECSVCMRERAIPERFFNN